MFPSERRFPNIVITGSVAIGKTTLANMLKEEFDFFRVVNVSDVCMTEHLYEFRDTERDTFVVDDDLVVAHLEELGVENGGFLLDYHSCGIFRPEWVDYVLVLRCPIEELARRLRKRGYVPKKVQENVLCEIMQVAVDEAEEGFPDVQIVQVPNVTFEHLQTTIQMLKTYVQGYVQEHGGQ